MPNQIAGTDNPELILVSRSLYNRLVGANNLLQMLYAAGVDNWEGYSEALNMQDEEEVEEED